jgi:hypothetical protein
MKPFNQAASLRAIRSGTFRNNNSERHTMRIHGQMYLCVDPPFVRLSCPDATFCTRCMRTHFTMAGVDIGHS